LSQQRTIEKEIEFCGRGLFGGEQARVRLKPAAVDAGIAFACVNGEVQVTVPARVEYLASRPRRTSLRNGTAGVETIEHCLAACAGLGVDNLLIEVNGPELPSGDGSSQHFVEALQSAGIVEQPAERRILKVTEPIHVARGESEIAALPCEEPGLHIIYELDYGPQSPIGRQVLAIDLTPEVFTSQLAGARTFVLEVEAQQLRQAGLGTHLGYQDILVFGPAGPIENQVRWPDECVRHKIQDLIGDLTLAGRPLQARIYARRSGHSLNHELVKQILALEEAAELAKKPAKRPNDVLLDIRRVQRILPHRYPFLMIDRIVEMQEEVRAVAIKNVTINEEFFQGHYPGHPIMPGVLILEAMAQLGGVLLSQKLEHTGKVAVLLSLDKVKFRRAVVPGDQLILEANAIRVKSRTGHVRCNARVGDELVAEADIKFMMVDADPV
jgi:UDP-3-O-[3-hydroxymyristoyl] N-acetylglucosamine deacetylase / 3-hydroxyacyl-[acyl-carrier-protein] dehydratase